MAFGEAKATVYLEPNPRKIGEDTLALEENSRACLVHILGVDRKCVAIWAETDFTRSRFERAMRTVNTIPAYTANGMEERGRNTMQAKLSQSSR